MSGNNVANGTINNNTTYPLWLVSSTINSGHWNTAPLTVPANTTLTGAFVAQGTSGTATGTSGQVVYNLNGYSPSTNVTLNFDDPYSSSNSASASSSTSGISATASVPKSGSNVVFTYTIGAA
ncbi:MAG TPA: hypothetical protein VKY89_14140 [Thermoanaerobaculia bacterium]|jgi:hypothetical protein|nr:hypothetical protein [Thermoanaerobaculia bacterium]